MNKKQQQQQLRQQLEKQKLKHLHAKDEPKATKNATETTAQAKTRGGRCGVLWQGTGGVGVTLAGASDGGNGNGNRNRS